MKNQYAFIQPRVKPADLDKNFRTMEHWIEKARAVGAKFFVFPELMLTGYVIGDAWEEISFLRDIDAYHAKVESLLLPNEAVVFGSVTRGAENLEHTDGRSVLFNSAIAIEKLGNGEVNRFVYNKILLPNYREFEEPRHFRAGTMDQNYDWQVLDQQFRIIICEDGWDAHYPEKPLQKPAASNLPLVINLSSSPFTRDKNRARDRIFGAHAKRLNTHLAYVNHIGLQDNGKTIYNFDGSTCIYDPHGEIIAQIPEFCTGMIQFNPDSPEQVEVIVEQENHVRKSPVTEAVLSAIDEMMEGMGWRPVVIGASGGIDSCVVAAAFAIAYKRKQIDQNKLILVNMPTKFNSQTTKDIAQELAQNLGATYVVHSIQDLFTVTKDSFVPNCAGELPRKLEQLQLENIQARHRSATVLAMYASSVGGVYTCNGNKSELTVGYCTLGGDLSGFFAPIADLWKHQVYELGRELNEIFAEEYGVADAIPNNSFEIVACAELSENHNVDEGQGDPIVYVYHDRLFHTWVEKWHRWGIEECLDAYLKGTLAADLHLPDSFDLNAHFKTAREFVEDLERWWNLFVGMGVVKRVQAPPLLAVSRRAFGFDYRESVGARRGYTLKYRELKSQLLNE